MPTARNAQGIDIVAYSTDGRRYLGIQVKSVSRLMPVPVGTSPDRVMGDYWIIVTKVTADPVTFILTSEEVRSLARPSGKDGPTSYWIEVCDYSGDEFREAWSRIGRGDEFF